MMTQYIITQYSKMGSIYPVPDGELSELLLKLAYYNPAKGFFRFGLIKGVCNVLNNWCLNHREDSYKVFYEPFNKLSMSLFYNPELPEKTKDIIKNIIGYKSGVFCCDDVTLQKQVMEEIIKQVNKKTLIIVPYKYLYPIWSGYFKGMKNVNLILKDNIKNKDALKNFSLVFFVDCDRFCKRVLNKLSYKCINSVVVGIGSSKLYSVSYNDLEMVCAFRYIYN